MRQIFITLVLFISLLGSIPPVFAAVSFGGTDYDYVSSYVLKDKMNTDSKGFNIIEDFSHYIAGFPTKMENGFITLDLTNPRYEDFQKMTGGYSDQDLQFALLSLGLIKEIDTKWSTKEAHVLIATALSFAAEKYQQPVPATSNAAASSGHTVVLVTPDDHPTLDMVSYTHDFANKLPEQATLNMMKPVDHYVQQRLMERKNFEILRNEFLAAGLSVSVIDGFNNGHQDYSEENICRTVFVTPTEAVFADYGAEAKKQYLQSQSSNLQDVLQKRNLKSFALTGIAFDGGKIQTGEKVLWILWNGDAKIPHELAEKLQEITGKILVPVILKNGVTTTPFYELAHGDILFNPADLDENFLTRLKKTYSGAFANKLIEATTKETSFDIINIGDDIFTKEMDQQIQKKLTDRGYKVHKINNLQQDYSLACKAIEIK